MIGAYKVKRLGHIYKRAKRSLQKALQPAPPYEGVIHMTTNMIPYERALRTWPFTDLFDAPFSLGSGTRSSQFDMDV